MTLLVLFAFVAGAGTAISPCVLPVLPALLSAGATGGRRRPLGIVAGLALTFSVTIVGLASVVDGVGLGSSGTRTLAIVLLTAFAIVTLVPALGDRVAAPLSRLARFGPRDGGSGFWSGVVVGGALGFLYAPCAGPILAAVITVSSASGNVIAIAIAYATGSAVVLLALALGGRALSDRVRSAGRGPALQRALGAVMLATALAMALDYDVRFQTAIADKLPATVVNPTRSLEDSARVKRRLEELRGPSKFAASADIPPSSDTDAPRRKGIPSDLPKLGTAPEFTGNQRWFNTPGGTPLTLEGLRGQVVLVDFWTYTCINCIRTFPALRALQAAYSKAGLTIVGVHSPEFDFEKDDANVAAAIKQNDLRYAVAQDNDLATWNAWGNRYWPAKYLIDAEGQVRYTHFGEGGDKETDDAIRSLLRERDGTPLNKSAQREKAARTARLATPETYLGTDRASGFTPGNEPQPGTHVFPAAETPPLNGFALSGSWTADGERATAGDGASLKANVQGKDVYLVLSPPRSGPGRVRVLLDGRPIAGRAGRDVSGGAVNVTRQRLYHLVSAPSTRTHRLELRFERGVSGYAFTFG